VPNTTAGLIIGKAGATIKHIMESTGAKVQLSQKPEQINLQVILLNLSLLPIYSSFISKLVPLTKMF